MVNMPRILAFRQALVSLTEPVMDFYLQHLPESGCLLYLTLDGVREKPPGQYIAGNIGLLTDEETAMYLLLSDLAHGINLREWEDCRYFAQYYRRGF